MSKSLGRSRNQTHYRSLAPFLVIDINTASSASSSLSTFVHCVSKQYKTDIRKAVKLNSCLLFSNLLAANLFAMKPPGICVTM